MYCLVEKILAKMPFHHLSVVKEKKVSESVLIFFFSCHKENSRRRQGEGMLLLFFEFICI